MMRPATPVATALALAALAALPGCLAGSGSGYGDGTGPSYCIDDRDCGEGATCTRVNECVSTDQVLRVELHWTVGGQPPTPQDPEACASIGDLEVVFHDPVTSDDVAYSPVPCELGQAVYDKMPPRLRSVEIDAYSPDGAPVGSGEKQLAESGDSQVLIDLQL